MTVRTHSDDAGIFSLIFYVGVLMFIAGTFTISLLCGLMIGGALTAAIGHWGYNEQMHLAEEEDDDVLYGLVERTDN